MTTLKWDHAVQFVNQPEDIDPARIVLHSERYGLA